MAPYVAGRNDVPNTCAGWVGSGPVTAGRSDTPIPFHGNPPEWGGTRSGSQYTGTSLEVQPASGTRVCAKSQQPRPPQVYRFQERHHIRQHVGILLERNGCGLRPDQGTRKSWGTGSSGMGRIHRDRAQLQGAQDPAAPRQRQGWHQGKPSTHASHPSGTRSAFTPNCVTRPMGHPSGVVCDDCRSSIVG